MNNAELEDFASLIRSVGSECTILNICGDKLIAGSRDGDVVCWVIEDGKEIWRISLGGPCISSESDGSSFFLSESDKIHSVDLLTGEIAWSIDLEGSGDLVCLSGNVLWATSSVYNFELQDYVDGAVWRIDARGKISGKWDIEGRAWSLAANEESATIGLSRPRCGLAEISPDNGVLYRSLENSSPVTAGVFADDGSIFLGHSDGRVSEVGESGLIEYELGSSVVNSIDINEGLVIGTDSGAVIFHDGHNSWEIMSRGNVDWVTTGPAPKNGDYFWACSWSEGSVISLIEIPSGSVDLELNHQYRVGVCCNSNDLIVLGDYVGGIYLFERSVLSRRLKQAKEIGSKTKDGVLLRRKIRSLRR